MEWGSAGVSIRIATPDRPEPLTIGWIFPPGRLGWMNLTDLSLGYDPWSANHHPSIQDALATYLGQLSQLSGAKPATTKNLKNTVFRLTPEVGMEHHKTIVNMLAELARKASNA